MTRQKALWHSLKSKAKLIDYENDDDYRDKLQMIKETYIGRSDKRDAFTFNFDVEEIDEEVVTTDNTAVTQLVESLDKLNPKR